MMRFYRGIGLILIVITLLIIYLSLWSFPSSDNNIKTIKTIMNMIIPGKSSSSSSQKKTLTPSELLSLSIEINNATSYHPIYKDFNIPIRTRTFEALEQVNVLLVVSSGPGRLHRRNAIRRTWWRECKEKPNVSSFLFVNKCY